MASTVPDLTNHLSAAHAQTGRLPAWLREPLLHFFLLGALLFGVDHLLASRTEDPRVIVIDESVDREALQVFRQERGREPDEEELYALRRTWLDNEVLYREGLALQMDRGDPAIRDKVIFKALSVIDAGLRPPAFDEQTLRDWFEENRVRYDEPARFDYLEAVLAGDNSEEAARSFAAALNAGASGDAQAGLRVFDDRPEPTLVESYGPEFARALAASPVGEWRALPTRVGWTVMRLEGVTPPKPADFERLAGVVRQDWIDWTMAEQRTAAVRALAKKYTVEVEAAQP